MRASLLPLAITAALAAACGSEVPSLPEQEETATGAPAPSPDRDLTLRTAPPAAATVEVASPVELTRPEPRPARAPRSRPAPRPAPAADPEPEAQPGQAPLALSAPAVVPIQVEPAPDEPAAGGRELAPGKTVTIIPASSGPSLEADEDDSWLPSERPRGIVGGSGGTCRPRGGVRGIGIAGRIPVGIPSRRVR